MGIVSRSLELSRDYFRAFFAICIAPLVGAGVISMAFEGQDWLTQVLIAIPIVFIDLVVWCATVLFASGALLDHPPDFATAYRSALRARLGTVLKASLMVIALIFAGSVAFIVPGFIAMAQLLLVTPVAILERRGAWDSLRRSRALGIGFHARNLATVFALFLPSVVAFFLAHHLGITGFWPDFVLMTLSRALEALSMLATVVIYIDMRARKESLDPLAFAYEIHAAYGRDDPA